MSETSSVESDRLSPEAKRMKDARAADKLQRMKEARAAHSNIVRGEITVGREGT